MKLKKHPWLFISSVIFITLLGCNTTTEHRTPTMLPTSDSLEETSSVATPWEQSPSTLFFLARLPSRSSVQVWKFELPQRIDTLVHENLQLDEFFREYLEDVIPTSELAIYTEFHDEYPQDKAEIAQFIDELTIAIAPDGEKLVWVEGIGWYPDIFEYGFSQVVVTDINSNSQSVVAEYNFHLPLVKNMPIVVRPGLIRIISLSWSSEAQYLAITTDFNKGAYQHLGIYNLQTQKLTEVELGEGASIPVWSNDSNLLAYSHATPIDGDVGYKSSIEIIKVHSDGQIDTEFNVEYDIVSFISGLNWAPDDTKIVAIASLGSLTDMNTLITVDVDSRVINNIVIEDFPSGLFSEPKWSPSGRYIGVNYRSDRNNFVERLIILEPELGQVLAILPLERPEPSWAWTQDENVAVVVGQAPTTPMQVSLWQWQSGETNLQSVFSGDYLGDTIDGNKPYISILGSGK